MLKFAVVSLLVIGCSAVHLESHAGKTIVHHHQQQPLTAHFLAQSTKNVPVTASIQQWMNTRPVSTVFGNVQGYSLGNVAGHTFATPVHVSNNLFGGYGYRTVGLNHIGYRSASIPAVSVASAAVPVVSRYVAASTPAVSAVYSAAAPAAASVLVAQQPQQFLSQQQFESVVPASVQQISRTVEYRAIPHVEKPVQPQVIEVDPSNNPVHLHFKTQSSTVSLSQSHTPAVAPEVQTATAQDEPARLITEVQKPVVQEVREVITPYRQVTQQINPVYESLHTVVSKGEGERQQYAVQHQPQHHVAHVEHVAPVAQTAQLTPVTFESRPIATAAAHVTPVVQSAHVTPVVHSAHVTPVVQSAHVTPVVQSAHLTPVTFESQPIAHAVQHVAAPVVYAAAHQVASPVTLRHVQSVPVASSLKSAHLDSTAHGKNADHYFRSSFQMPTFSYSTVVNPSGHSGSETTYSADLAKSAVKSY